jgi:CheY-like chemotaxis protein
MAGYEGRVRVLVVDDDPAIRLVCSTWLRLEGYDVIEAADGGEALELAVTEKPALMLLDLSMPVLDGLGVAQALREREDTRELPIVVLSAETDVRLARRAYELGVAGYFTKPFDPSAVAGFVRGVIADVRARPGTADPGGRAAQPKRSSRASVGA